MADFYEELRDGTARPLFIEYGLPVLLKCPGEGIYDSVSGLVSEAVDTEYSGYGVVVEYSTKDVDGTIITQADKKLLLILDNPDIAPTVSHTVEIAGHEYEVKNVSTLSPGGVDIMHTIQVRK
jgi:hypothetical protein